MADVNLLKEQTKEFLLDRCGVNCLERSDIDSLYFYISDKTHDFISAVYEPSLCIILQGTKAIGFGDEMYGYDEQTYALASTHVPLNVSLKDASKEKPYISLSIKFSLDEVYEVLKGVDVKEQSLQKSEKGIFFGELRRTCPLVPTANAPNPARGPHSGRGGRRNAAHQRGLRRGGRRPALPLRREGQPVSLDAEVFEGGDPQRTFWGHNVLTTHHLKSSGGLAVERQNASGMVKHAMMMMAGTFLSRILGTPYTREALHEALLHMAERPGVVSAYIGRAGGRARGRAN